MSYTPKTTTNKRKCRLGLDLMSNEIFSSPELRSCVTALSSKDVNNSGVNSSNLRIAKKQRNSRIPKKSRKNAENVLKDITNISYSLANERHATPLAAENGMYKDYLSGDDDTEMDDYNVDDQGILEEIDDELDIDCSSQDTTDSENEQIHFDVSVQPETTPIKGKQYKRKARRELSGCALNSPKSTTSKKEDSYLDEGDPEYTCGHCGAIMWYGERINKRKNSRNPSFTLCCGQGQVQLPLLKDPPTALKSLMEGDDAQSKHFQRNMRPYNMVFSFTSLGGKVERCVKKGNGPDMFQLQGENYHLMDSLQPPDGREAKFGQLYIVDTENEAENRSKCLSKGNQRFQVKKKDGLKKEIIEVLMKMLNEVNPYVKQFRSARDRFDTNPEDAFHMRIVSDRLKDGRTYNTPTASEVAALIPGDFNLDMNRRDIVLQKHCGKLKRINEIHVSYLALQYPLLFSYGEDGFRLGIKKGVTEATKKHKKATISMRQFFAFRLQERKNESHCLLHARRLFQQFLVDAYTTIESNRLRYLKCNQSTLRSDSYDSIKESESAGKIDMHHRSYQQSNQQSNLWRLQSLMMEKPRSKFHQNF
ncbi:hypothetical protein N665_2724s0004 [Sinapis alba]|nr:hypothetical protein N665_2724s0004 [Sinapis alba]